MNWPKGIIADLKNAAAATPLHCPRGWGDVSFQVNVDVEPWPPFLVLSRQCPIAGVEKCISCRHPFNPQKAELLRDELIQLRALVDDGLMSEAEYSARRRMALSFQLFGVREPGRASSVAAFILTPIGAVIGAAGLWCAVVVHPAFWAAVAGGGLILGLGGSFAGISYRRRRDAETLLSAGDDVEQLSHSDQQLL
ncbi:MAG: SHOCT domain-containing protein [Desulfobacterales bacterium]